MYLRMYMYTTQCTLYVDCRVLYVKVINREEEEEDETKGDETREDKATLHRRGRREVRYIELELVHLVSSQIARGRQLEQSLSLSYS